jgi:hypothetical protein
MSIKLGDNVPKLPCTSIKKGVLLRLFDLKCTPQLHRFPDPVPDINTQKKTCVRSARKELYISIEASKFIKVCDTEANIRFAKRKFLIRMQVKQLAKCPFNNPPVTFGIDVSYNEATNPNNGVNSAMFREEYTWTDDGSPQIKTISTASIGDVFGRGSSGIGNCTLTLYIIDDAPDNPCSVPNIGLHAHLDSLGLPIDWLVGTAIDQYKIKSCPAFQAGIGGMSGFWTGVNWGGSPIGLVMNLNYNVYGIPH